MAIKMDGNVITELELHASDGTTTTKQLTEELNLQQKTATVNGDVTPDAGYDGLSKVVVNVEGGGELPELTNPASAADILDGKEAIDGNGAKLVGTCTYDADTSDANAVASDIAQGKTAYVNGVKIIGTASGGGEASIEPFDTYEFTIETDARYDDEQGTADRTFATFEAHDALINRLQTYADRTYDNPLMHDGKAYILARVEVKNPAVFVADANNTFFRKDEEKFLYLTSTGSIAIDTAPYCRKRTLISGGGTFSYAGDYENTNDFNAMYVRYSDTKLLVSGRLAQYHANVVKAGDYVLKFYDLTDVME